MQERKREITQKAGKNDEKKRTKIWFFWKGSEIDLFFETPNHTYIRFNFICSESCFFLLSIDLVFAFPFFFHKKTHAHEGNTQMTKAGDFSMHHLRNKKGSFRMCENRDVYDELIRNTFVCGCCSALSTIQYLEMRQGNSAKGVIKMYTNY